MTPHRTKAGLGTFMIDRQLRGIGRVKRASGTTDSRVLKGINGMLSTMHEAGMFPQLEAIRDGKIHPLVAYATYKRTGIKGLPDANAMETVEAAWTTWNNRVKNKSTRRMHQNSWKHVASALPDGGTFAQLPDAVLSLRDTLEDHPPAFNRARASVLAFLRDRLGKKHSVYETVSGIPAMKEEPVNRSAPTIERAMQIRDGLPEKAASIWWSMVTTGMGLLEYDSAWELHDSHVSIPGTKRKDRVRVVPRLGTPQRRDMGWKQYKKVLTAMGVQPYDARRAYEHILEEAQVSRTRCKLYMGHALRDVTDRYGRADLNKFLASDRLALLAYIAEAERQITVKRRADLRLA